ncbi:MAG: V-type ATP synthase subunit K [bacterium]
MVITLGLVLALVGIFLAVVMSGIGSSIGIGYAGSAANGVMSEDPERFGSLILLVAIPGTQGVYGFLTGFLMILKLNVLSGRMPQVGTFEGLSFLAACLPIAIAGLVSAIYQGKVATAGIYLEAKKKGESTKGLIMAVFVEFYAVLGLLTSIFLWLGLPQY